MLKPDLQELGEKYYQYTGIDEFTRIRYTWFTNEHNTYSSSEFAKRLVKYFKRQYDIEVKTIQTDNGFEFTNRLNWNAFNKDKKTMFESTLEKLGIEYTVIKPHTPKQMEELKEVIERIKKGFITKEYFTV